MQCNISVCASGLHEDTVDCLSEMLKATPARWDIDLPRREKDRGRDLILWQHVVFVGLLGVCKSVGVVSPSSP